MRSILLLTILFLASNQVFSQEFYFKSNLTGWHRFTDRESFHQEDVIIREDSLYQLAKVDFDEIEFSSNESTIGFDLRKLQINEGDTLLLDFIQYQRKDTVYLFSGYAYGSKSKKKTSYIKRNKGSMKIKDLPDSIAFSLNGVEMYAMKSINTIVAITSGNGRKKGKRWGFDKTTYATRVTYVY